jgi:capsular polysaccharide transport system permease protein
MTISNEERIRRWRERRQDDAGAAGGEQPLPRASRLDDPAGDAVSEGFAAPPLTDLDVAAVRDTILERRRLRFRAVATRVAIFAGIPLLVFLLYVGFVATPLYRAEAVFTVQTSSEAAPSPTAGIFSIGSAGSTIADAFKAREYILSRPMMNYMQKRYGFLDHFASPAMDPLTRFQSPLGLNERPYSYYLKRVRVSVDVQEGILKLYVYARTREDATRFGNAIMNAAEEHVNALSQKMSDDQVSSLAADVRKAELDVQESRRALAIVQARRGDLSPEQTATAVCQLISNLELQLAEAQRQRASLLDQGLTNSPLLPRLEAQISELRSQIADQKRRLVNPGGGSLQRAVSDVESATANKEIAQARYTSALNTLQQAYLKILEQRRYFVTIVAMSAGEFPKVRDALAIAWPLLLLLALVYALIFARRRFEPIRIREVFDRWRSR